MARHAVSNLLAWLDWCNKNGVDGLGWLVGIVEYKLAVLTPPPPSPNEELYTLENFRPPALDITMTIYSKLGCKYDFI